MMGSNVTIKATDPNAITPEDIRETLKGVREMYDMTPDQMADYRDVFNGFGGWMIELLLEVVQDVRDGKFTDAAACCAEAAKLEECMGQE